MVNSHSVESEEIQMNELAVRMDEMKRLYMAVGRVLGEDARTKMAPYCLARSVELFAADALLADVETIHNSN